MSEAMLEFRQVDVYYGVIQALKQVSLQVNPGETVALIGANGAGKTLAINRPTTSRRAALPRPRKDGVSFLI